MNEEGLIELGRLFLPHLSRAQQEDLWHELQAFPNNKTIYSADPPSDMLQGDGWRGFVAIDFQTLERKTVSGIVLSNSCDISLDNHRALPATVLFAPLIRLSAYVALLEQAGQTTQQIAAMCDSIAKQRTTSIFYLHAIENVAPERIALLSDVRPQPLELFAAGERSRLFSLNQFGFYLFLFKLSVHFTRMGEAVPR